MLTLIAMDHYLFFNISERNLLGKMFGSPHTSNQIYLLWNFLKLCIDRYLKDMYITLKGTGKTLFVSVLRTLLICKFLNFPAAFTKKIKLSKV